MQHVPTVSKRRLDRWILRWVNMFKEKKNVCVCVGGGVWVELVARIQSRNSQTIDIWFRRNLKKVVQKRPTSFKRICKKTSTKRELLQLWF